MSIENTGHDILDRYRGISNKLKKRFLRKPNVTEASESYSKLAQNCESQELPSYAGLCYIAASKCEESLGNVPGETSCLIQSARQFFKAEETDYDLGCEGIGVNNLADGLSCHDQAASRFTDNNLLAVSLNLEVVEFLKSIDRDEYVQSYLESAVELAVNEDDTKIYCLELLATHFIDIADYVGALETFQQITKIIESLQLNGARSDTLLKCEICSVFLLLILRPSPQKLSPNLAKILEKYTWGDRDDKSLRACKMTENLYILLQSLVMICQSLDTSSLVKLEGEFWKILAADEKNLLRILVKTYYI